ncbi:MAG: hypothetical protein EP332_08115 [Bacteroidetes bacterium]|nr:MAG: hypothetical protein EP332_08115 [Bacteroidota bacterium]
MQVIKRCEKIIWQVVFYTVLQQDFDILDLEMNLFMKRNYSLGVMSFLSIIILLHSCLPSGPVSTISFGGPRNLHFIQPEMISQAQKLKSKFPKDDFYCLQSEVRVEYFIPETEEAEEKKGKRRSSRNKDVADLVKEMKEETKEELTKDDSLMITGVKARVTYYNKVVALRDYAEFGEGIPYNNRQKVKDIYVSYNEAEDDWFIPLVVDQSMDGDGIFYSDARMKMFTASAPGLGTTISYIYTVEYDNVNYLTDIYFPEYFPIEKRDVVFQIPEWMEVELMDRNLMSFNITKSETNITGSKIDAVKKSIANASNSSDDDDEDDSRSNRRNSSRKKKSNDVLKYVSYAAKEIPAGKREYRSTGPSYNYPHVLILNKSYQEGGVTKNLFTNTNDLYSWYRTLVSGVDNDTAEIRKKAIEIIGDAKTDREKVEKIYYWVQDNVRYIAFEDGVAGFRPDASQKVLKNRYGDCKGMANLTTQLLRSVGFDARLTWIGTNRIAYDYTIPSIAVDNHMISCVFLDGKKYFLDATEPYCALGDYGYRIQGRPVLIEDGENFLIDTVPSFDYTRNRNEKTEQFALNGLKLQGKVKESYNGESKTFLLYTLNNEKSDRKSRLLERFVSNEDVNLKVSNVQSSHLEERDKPIEFTYDLTVNNKVLKNGKDLFLNLEWDGQYGKFELDSNRLTDVQLRSKEYHAKTTEVNLGSNASAKHLPASLNLESPYWVIKLSYELKGQKLIYKKQIIFPQGRIPKSELNAWNDARSQLRAFYDDYAVITLK